MEFDKVGWSRLNLTVMGDGAAMQCTFATEPCNVRTSD